MRVLAITALAFSAAVFASNYILPPAWLPALALLCAAAGGAILLPRSRWLRGFALLAFGLAIGFGCFWLNARHTTVPAAALDGETRYIRAEIADWPQSYERYTRVVIRLRTEGLPPLNALLYDNENALREAEPGQRIELEARLRPADRRYGERYLGYNARDIYLIASSRGEIAVTEDAPGLRYWPQHLNRRILGLVRTLFPADTASFIEALLLGDKTELYRDEALYQALNRAGLMHVVAVSGMHIAFLIGLLRTILGRSRACSVTCILIVWLFVLVTGASPSAVRAAIMQTLLLTASLFRRENDPLTSLSAALALILLGNPHAAASVSLQLSFASIAGILCFSEGLEEPLYARLPSLRSRFLGRTAVGAVTNSLSVMPFAVPLMCLHFGSVPLLAPLTNLLALWAVTLCFCGACLLCAVGALCPPLGKLLAWLLSWLVRYIFLTARWVSSIPFSTVYLETRAVWLWLLLCYALFLAFRFVKRGKLVRLGIPALLSVLSLAALLTAARLAYAGETETIAALDVGQGQCLAVLSGDNTLLIDCGGLGTAENAGEIAGRYLLTRGRWRVDALILTHLDTDHVNGVDALTALCPVKTMILPEAEDTGNGMPEEIKAAAARRGTEMRVLREDSLLALGGIRVQLFAPEESGTPNEHGLAAVVSLGDYDMLVTGDMSRTKERALLKQHPLEGIELYIVGHHGSPYASSRELLESIGADTAVISCGYNTYGHPAPETLLRLAECGYTVFRTDENGTVEIRIGRDHG